MKFGTKSMKTVVTRGTISQSLPACCIDQSLIDRSDRLPSFLRFPSLRTMSMVYKENVEADEEPTTPFLWANGTSSWLKGLQFSLADSMEQ